MMRSAHSRARASTKALLTASACSVLLVCAGGCLKRTISITTQPEGALVWLNDVEVGRTPLKTEFAYFGTYDVRIRREGFEPIITKAKARAPIHETPGIDLAAEALPVRLDTNIAWHWDLTPVAENAVGKEQAERELIDRANELRGQVQGAPPAALTPAETPATPAAQ